MAQTTTHLGIIDGCVKVATSLLRGETSLLIDYVAMELSSRTNITEFDLFPQ